jgi:hypothetical protein
VMRAAIAIAGLTMKWFQSSFFVSHAG